MLATCSYQEFKPSMGLPVRISLGVPKFPLPYVLSDSATVEEIMPRWSYMRTSFDSYREQYLDQLYRFGVARIQSRFSQLQHRFQAADLCLLCFESKPDSWCHRHLLSFFWLRETGEVIPELGRLRPRWIEQQCQTEED